MKHISLLSGAFMLLAACAQQTNTVSLQGKEFKLLNAPENADITIAFDAKENRYYGNGGINNYFGQYQISGDQLQLGGAGSTMMAGPEALMNAEHDYFVFLNGVKTYRLEQNKLFLVSEDKTLEFEQTK